MQTLKQVLGDYAIKRRDMGAPEGMAPQNVDRTGLTAALSKIRDRNSVFFWICVVMTVVIFIVSLFITLKNIDAPEKIQATYAAVGISTIGIIYYMVKLWKEKTSIDLLLILVADLEPSAINSILVVLLEKLK